MMLSGLGGSDGSTARRPSTHRGPCGFNIEHWRHLATQGRDGEEKVVEVGLLAPFGHRASLVTVSEQNFAEDGSSAPAYLFREEVAIVREPDLVDGPTGLFTAKTTSADARSVDRQLPLDRGAPSHLQHPDPR